MEITAGHITFLEGTDVARLLSKLDNRRVEGAWEKMVLNLTLIYM